jgi:hypothetical protein
VCRCVCVGGGVASTLPAPCRVAPLGAKANALGVTSLLGYCICVCLWQLVIHCPGPALDAHKPLPLPHPLLTTRRLTLPCTHTPFPLSNAYRATQTMSARSWSAPTAGCCCRAPLTTPCGCGTWGSSAASRPWSCTGTACGPWQQTTPFLSYTAAGGTSRCTAPTWASGTRSCCWWSSSLCGRW